MLWYFVFFLISGFCGILYELVWLRLAMAQYGVTTPVVSMVLSAFMGGLGIGSLAAGKLIRRYGQRISFPPLWLYAGSELLIGISAMAVPSELIIGHRILSHLASSTEFSSVTYSLISGVCIALTLVPWCALMGATIPVAMFAVRSDPRLESRRSFSFLYVSNLLGAMLGAILPLAIIEFRGFHFTLLVGMLLNFLIASSAFAVAQARKIGSKIAPEPNAPVSGGSNQGILAVLFMTGLTSMGMEVIWIRLYTPFVGVMVYSFALILVTYLSATFLGSFAYRSFARNPESKTWIPLAALSLLAVLPVFACQPGHMNFLVRVLLGIAPFSAAVGYLTPQLVDLWSQGDADRAAHAYAVNVLGCILGPLLAGFILLPLTSERWGLFVFAAPWILFGLSDLVREYSSAAVWKKRIAAICFLALTLFATLKPKAYESIYPQHVLLRDNTATVIAAGKGVSSRLLVNGVGITTLTPTTKAMAHLPLAFLDHSPDSVLVICFGMGTTFRSALSWGVHVTAVDLVPSVPKLFWYYHPDAPELLRSPLSHVIIDDGRRYLDRTSDKFDLITIDPPPPLSAAGSSLLYSKEFYAVAKKHLKPHGILEQWLPSYSGDPLLRSSIAQAIKLSFVHVRAFRSIEGWGVHLLASDWPIPERTAQDLAGKLGAKAATDFVEWGPEATTQDQFNILLNGEFNVNSIVAAWPSAPPLRDDRPTNEYFAVRYLRYLSSHQESVNRETAKPTSR
jgi:predicted membrane-bound spermidine synthase